MPPSGGILKFWLHITERNCPVSSCAKFGDYILKRLGVALTPDFGSGQIGWGENVF